MSCKCLTVIFVKKPVEIGDSLNPQPSIKMPTCELGRQPNILGWVAKCKEIPEKGPCWWFAEEYPGVPDIEFETRCTQ